MAIENDLSEVMTSPLTNKTSVFWHIEQGLLKNPHEAAILCMHQPPKHLSNLLPVDEEARQQNGDTHEDCLTLSYTQLHRVAITLAAGFIANGAQPGSTTLMFVPNSSEYGILLWTCILMRVAFVCFDPSALNAAGGSELKHTIETLKPGLIVVPSIAGSKVVDKVVKESGLSQPLRILLEGDTPEGWKSLLDLADDASKSPIDEAKLLEDARKEDPDRIHSIFFTSGTSVGRPKGCPQHVGSMTHILHSMKWLINENNCARALQQFPSDRGIAPQTTLMTWSEGGTLVIPGSLAIKETMEAITKYGATFIVLTPPMVHGVALELASRSVNVDSVRTIQVGGDAVTKDVLVRCAALFPKATVLINHGMTEGAGLFKWPFFDIPLFEIPFFGEVCPVGAIAPGVQVRIWDADNRRVTRRGELGELHVSCESVIRHYLDRVSESSFYEDENGRWFNSGDVAMINEDGLVFVLGRAKDIIRRGGVGIVPAPLESSIEKFTGSQVSNDSVLTNITNMLRSEYDPAANNLFSIRRQSYRFRTPH